MTVGIQRTCGCAYGQIFVESICADHQAQLNKSLESFNREALLMLDSLKRVPEPEACEEK